MSGFPKRPSVRRLIREGSPYFNDLSDYEMEIVKLIDSGAYHGQMCAELGISINILRETLQRIYKKLHLHETSMQRSYKKKRLDWLDKSYPRQT